MSKSSGALLLKRAATRIFLREVGITADPFTELEEFKLACEMANPRYSSMAGEKQDLVRFQLNEDPTKWSEQETDAILNLAGTLGMTGGKETPLRGSFDLICATAGARRSTLQRSMYAVQAILDGKAEADMIVIAGSTRPLIPAEIPFVENYASGGEDARDEFDCCTGARDKILERNPDLTVTTVCHHDSKAGTEDIIDEVMSVAQFALKRKRLDTAWVTTQIYVSGTEQKAAAARINYPGSTFFVAGHASDPEAVYNRSLSVYLSECLTTLRSAAIAASLGC